MSAVSIDRRQNTHWLRVHWFCLFYFLWLNIEWVESTHTSGSKCVCMSKLSLRWQRRTEQLVCAKSYQIRYFNWCKLFVRYFEFNWRLGFIDAKMAWNRRVELTILLVRTWFSLIKLVCESKSIKSQLIFGRRALEIISKPFTAQRILYTV